MKYRNPVIPGFYPDPSVCRVGEDYYLAASSFDFFPGVPLFHSRDLINWEQIGHVLTRKSQVMMSGASASGGIYAPTLRYHNGRFYMITTNVNGRAAKNGYPMLNFIVHTDDIRGEWSDPVPVDHVGIDPSLFWDDDGRCYYIGTHFLRPEGTQCIGQFEIDPDTGERLSETREIWRGDGGKYPEGPHMYKIGGKYYLMVAEGGTEWGHMEAIARADNVWGPFEGCPHNPIVTNRDYQPGVIETLKPDFQPLGCIGHADLVDDINGNWWAFMLGVRPSRAQLHHIGRETMLAPVEWKDGWPIVNGGRPIKAEMEAPDSPHVQLDSDGWAIQRGTSFSEDFTSEKELPVRWAYLRDYKAENYRFEGGLVLTAGEDDLNGLGNPTFVGVRQRSMVSVCEAAIEFDPQSENPEAGITVYHTNEHHYDIIVSLRDGKRVAYLYRRAADMEVRSEPVELPASGRIELKIVADKLRYEFFASGIKLGEGGTQLISTEVMPTSFTGCLFGAFCQGEPGAEMRLLSFSVTDK